MARTTTAAEVPLHSTAAESTVPGTDFTPPPEGVPAGFASAGPVTGAAAAASVGVPDDDGAAAPPAGAEPEVPVTAEQALGGRLQAVGSRPPTTDPSWDGTADTAAQRHGACDWNRARIWTQHASDGDEELPMK